MTAATRARRREPGSLIAFLDVMACGLGAAVLLFLIVKHHTEDAVEPDPVERAAVNAETLAALRAEAETLAGRIERAQRRAAQRAERETDAERRRAEDRARLAAVEREIERAQAANAALRRRVESIEPHRTDDVIEDVRGGEEDYLLGLKVEGRRIAILIDRSASMTDERLIDIIRRKVRTDAEKRDGPKWRRTLRTARWLLHRLPAGSEVAVIAFNDEATMLHGEGWADGRDRATLRALFDELDAMVPTGATNLEAGLRSLGRLSPGATDIYVVTDGLPTRSLSSPGLLSGCSRNSKGKVSGECRKLLFAASLRNSAPPPGRKVHVILLPLEGDPEAAPAFWSWTAQAGGLLLAPARGWP